MSISNKLKLNNDEVISIESSTRNQANDLQRFKHRKNRSQGFTNLHNSLEGWNGSEIHNMI